VVENVMFRKQSRLSVDSRAQETAANMDSTNANIGLSCRSRRVNSGAVVRSLLT
jgi:hypothetical protein